MVTRIHILTGVGEMDYSTDARNERIDRADLIRSFRQSVL